MTQRRITIISMGCTSSHLPLEYTYASVLPNTENDAKGLVLALCLLNSLGPYLPLSRFRESLQVPSEGERCESLRHLPVSPFSSRHA